MHLLSFSNVVLVGIFAIHGELAAGVGVSPSLSLDRPRGYRFGKPVAPRPAAPTRGGGPDVYRPGYKESGGAVESTVHILDHPYIPLQPAPDDGHSPSVSPSVPVPEGPTVGDGASLAARGLARTREVSPGVKGSTKGCQKMSGTIAVTEVATGRFVGFVDFDPYSSPVPGTTAAFIRYFPSYIMEGSNVVSFTACPNKPFTASVLVRENWSGGPGADFPIAAINTSYDGVPGLSSKTYLLGTVRNSKSKPAHSDVLWELATDGSNTLTATAGIATLPANVDYYLVLTDSVETTNDFQTFPYYQKEMRFTFVPDTVEPA